MTEFEDNTRRLDEALQEIEASLSGTEEVSRTFRSEIETMTQSMTVASQQATGLSRSMGTSLKTAFSSLIVGGDKLSDVMRKLGSNMASKALSSAITPVTNALGSGVQGMIQSFMPFKNGGVMGQGRVRAFANGGVVGGPTYFPMKGGTGLMGEAGPEAIMPLARGADGKLGVRSGGGNVVNVTMNIQTPDAESFQKSRSQIAAQFNRALAQGQRNM